MKMSDIITCSSKELSLLEKVMMPDIITCFSKSSKSLLQQVKMSDIITCSGKESSLLKEVKMLDIFTNNFTGGLAPSSNQDIPGDISLLLACYGQNVRKEGNLEISNTTR